MQKILTVIINILISQHLSIFAMDGIDKLDHQLGEVINAIQFKTLINKRIEFYGKRYDSEMGCDYEESVAIPDNWRKITCFDARPIEEAVLYHMQHNQLLPTPKFVYLDIPKKPIDICPLSMEQRYKSHSIDNHRSPLSLQTLALIAFCQNKHPFLDHIIEKCEKVPPEVQTLVINFFLENPKAAIFDQHYRDRIVEKFHIESRLIFQSAHDAGLQAFLQKINLSNLSFKDLPEIQQTIEFYLKKRNNITIPITHCILKNWGLFHGYSSLFSPASCELARWLLCEKEGWYYLDTLLATCLSEEEHFLECFTLVRHYYMSNKVSLQTKDWLLQAASKGKSEWVRQLINANLYSALELNSTLLSVIIKSPDSNIVKLLIQRGANNLNEALHYACRSLKAMKYNVHLDDCTYDPYHPSASSEIKNKQNYCDIYSKIIRILLKNGADPNQLFYRSKKGIKKYYLRKNVRNKKNIQLLLHILAHPKRIRELDESSDLEYLKSLHIPVTSLFDNNSRLTDHDLYDYAMRVYTLAFEGCKTNNFQPLRDLIIDQHKKSTRPMETKIDIPACTQESTKNQVLKPTWLSFITSKSFNIFTKIAAMRFWFWHKMSAAYLFGFNANK